MKKIFVSDFTLRQIAQSRGGALTFREKTNMARGLDSLGVDAIELAPLCGTKESVIINKTIASAVKNSAVCLSVGDSVEGIAEAWACLKEAKSPCLQVILPVSAVQMEYVCHKKPPQVLELIARLCYESTLYCPSVEFIAVDASRADRAFLIEACQTAEGHGACRVCLCDDAGVCLPEDMAALVREVGAAVKVPVHVQPSDLIGMASANAAAALTAGAAGVKSCISDKGSLSTAAVADLVRVKGEQLGLTCALSVTDIHTTVSALTRRSGDTGEPDAVAITEQRSVTLDADCSLATLREAVESLGYELSDRDYGRVYEELQRVCQKKQSIGQKELEAIIATNAMQVPSTFHLDGYVVSSGSAMESMAHVTLSRDGTKSSGLSTGDGPIDASFRAIEQIIGHHYELDDFQIHAVTEGRGAVGSALVRLRAGGKLYSGNGISTDIVGASIRAYLNALNKIVHEEN
ncbi:MAG: alpha-isopropylmalate synthase regulatory domain-containing protein [Eubacteriales bacterium]